jgi:hypothetical protein
MLKTNVSKLESLKDYKRYVRRSHNPDLIYREREGEIFMVDGIPVLVVSFGRKYMV